MKYRVQPGRRLGRVAVSVAAMVLVASCGGTKSSTDGAKVATPAPSHSAETGMTANAGAGTGVHGVHGKSAAPPPAAPLRAGERFVNLTVPKPYTPAPPGGGFDEYRCFLLDPGLTESAFLTGSQFLPQNMDIAHHGTIYLTTAAEAKSARKLDAKSPGEGWRCFGPDTGDGAWVGHWAPGANETLLTQKVGYPMPAGSQLVLQMHYSLLAAEGKPAGADRPSVRLRLADGKARIAPLMAATLGAPVELPCTPEESGPLCDRDAALKDLDKRNGKGAGTVPARINEQCNKGKAPVAGPTQHCDSAVGKMGMEGTLYTIAGHMHLLGRSIKVELNPGRPGARTLLDLPAYNFDEQAIRPLATPVRLKASDNLRVTCTHDASLRKALPVLRNTPARYVAWGEGTADEMCMAILAISPKS